MYVYHIFCDMLCDVGGGGGCMGVGRTKGSKNAVHTKYDFS